MMRQQFFQRQVVSLDHALPCRPDIYFQKIEFNAGERSETTQPIIETVSTFDQKPCLNKLSSDFS